MRLPEGFPHTRHEQYLMALPVALLSSTDAALKKLLDVRFRYYLRSSLLPLVEEAAARGLSVEEWAEEFVAAFEGSVPPAFRQGDRQTRHG